MCSVSFSSANPDGSGPILTETIGNHVQASEEPWKPSEVTNDDEDTTSAEDDADSPRSHVSSRSWGCDSLVEICSICPVPSVAKEGVLVRKPPKSLFSSVTRSKRLMNLKRYFVVRDGCLEVWPTKTRYDNNSGEEEVICLRDLKDMDQYQHTLTLTFKQGQSAKRQLELCAESAQEAVDWFEAIEFVLKNMSMPIRYSLCETPVFQPSILQDFQRLVDHCFVPKNTRDRKGQQLPKGIKVVKVVRVQNSTLLRAYNEKKHQIANELKDHDRQSSCAILTPDVRTCLLDPPLPTLPLLENQSIERWMFHGTKPQSLEGITKSNFDLGRAGSGAGEMYGKGIYCAECCSKADEYTEEDHNGLRGLLLCRATLGKILYTNAKCPNAAEVQQAKTFQGSHTILGDRWSAVGTYREFIFGEKEQLYPEFIIYYQRVY